MTRNRRAACECPPFDRCSCDQTHYQIRPIDAAAARRAGATDEGPMGPHTEGVWWLPSHEIDADTALEAAYREAAALAEWY